MTQIPPENVDKQPGQQRHQPLVFLSDSFQGSQKRWSTIEKEAYPIVQARDKLRHSLTRENP